MDQATLVNLDIKRGSELLDALDRAKLKVTVALWVYFPEYEDWRLVVSARRFDSLDPRDATVTASLKTHTSTEFRKAASQLRIRELLGRLEIQHQSGPAGGHQVPHIKQRIRRRLGRMHPHRDQHIDQRGPSEDERHDVGRQSA